MTRAMSHAEQLRIADQILALESQLRAVLQLHQTTRTTRTRSAAVDRLEAAVYAVEDPTLRLAVLATWAEAQVLRWQLAMSATRVAHQEARRLHAASGMSEHDLQQEGFLGLLAAAKRFDPNRGFRFTTYARWWVRAQITRAIEGSRLIRMSSGAAEQLRNLRRQIRVYEAAGTTWTMQQLATELGIDVDRTRMLLGIGPSQSIDDADEDSPTLPALIDEQTPDPEEWTSTRQRAESLRAAIAKLTEREQAILRGRYGIGEDERSLASVASGLDLSRERIRQIECASLAALRAALGGQ